MRSQSVAKQLEERKRWMDLEDTMRGGAHMHDKNSYTSSKRIDSNKVFKPLY